MPISAHFMRDRPGLSTDVVRAAGRAGSPRGGACTDRTDGRAAPTAGGPPPPRDYAPLSAGWGAALGTLLLASRDKGEEPVRPIEIVPLGVATFALSKLVAKA